jgi:hypothetical protein
MTAVADGAVARVSHSHRNNTPLTTKDVVTSVSGRDPSRKSTVQRDQQDRAERRRHQHRRQGCQAE